MAAFGEMDHPLDGGTKAGEMLVYSASRQEIRCPRCKTTRPLSRLPKPGERVTCGCGHSQRVPHTYVTQGQ